MKILAIDPGPEKSALLIYDVDKKEIAFKAIEKNDECERIILKSFLYDNEANPSSSICYIEMPECFGMPVGKSVLHTCRWVGKYETLVEQLGSKTNLISRSEVKLYLCGSKRAKDSNIRQALIDKFGGNREKAIGTKKNPGPLYGIKKDLWSALAIAVTYAETNK
jgi:hypothetical protein